MYFKMSSLVSAMLFAAPVLAQTAPVADAPAPKPVKEKKICRRSDAPTGSLLGAAAICHTQAEWDRIDTTNTRNADTLLSQARALQNSSR